MPSSSEVEGTPAEFGQPADVEQLARGVVRPRGVEGDRTGVADGAATTPTKLSWARSQRNRI
jgi:hypothetical protein